MKQGWNHKSAPWRPSKGIEKHVDSRAAMSLASEVIGLLRHLLNTSSMWRDKQRDLLVRNILDIPALFYHEPKDADLLKRIWHDLAALSIIGGFPEPLRIGGSVELRKNKKESPTKKERPTYHQGVIVGLDVHLRKAKVIYKDCSKRILHTVKFDEMRAIPEIAVSPSVFALSSPGILDVFCFFLKTRFETPALRRSDSFLLRSWDVAYTQMKSCSIIALASLLTDPASTSLLVKEKGAWNLEHSIFICKGR